MKLTHIITLTYIKPAEVIAAARPKHRAFLDRGYQQGLFIASGPNDQQNGGVILASGDINEIKNLLKEDPFMIEGIADYQYHSFSPVKHAEKYSPFI